MAKILVTTAIPYVNAPPHLGHALELIEADAFARYQRQNNNDVFFLTGTDENSLKTVKIAEKENMAPKQLADRNAEIFKNLRQKLNIDFDGFIRTTEPRHIKGAQKLWNLCKKDIYKKRYRGLYCIGCESFYLESNLSNGLCPDHKTKPEVVEEENYFFKLSNYQEQLYELISEDAIKIIPEKRKNEMLGFIKQGLEDFSISRSQERAKNWGVPVPSDNTQIMYVWFDALSNYITGLDFAENGELYKKYWENGDRIVHIIGKDILRFHAIYWPAMLLSAGLRLPTEIFAHGFVTTGGEKMSKTLGNIVDPLEIAKNYGIDSLRFYLLKEVPAYDDGEFTIEEFVNRYNGDLANGLGNLVSRVLALVKKSGKETIKENKDFKKKITEVSQRIKNNMDIFKFNEALNNLWELIDFANQYIDSTAPWNKKGKELNKILSNLLFAILNIAKLIKPFLPGTSDKLFNKLNLSPDSKKWDKIKISNDTSPSPLFKRI